MRIAFVDVSRWDYTVETAYRQPLGGSHSALCYLAENLALLGHELRLFNAVGQVSISRGVTCAPLARIAASAWKELDVVVLQNWSKLGVELRPRLRHDAKLMLWTQHADDQPAMHALSVPEYRDAFDRFVFVSEWQRRRYADVYGIAAEKSKVLRNAIGPAFEKQLDSAQPKAARPVLAYTSTPFRGLGTLLDLFPAIRAAVPKASLQVYSSMSVYQMPAEQDRARYGQLYDRCRSLEGVEYIGSLPQPELAERLASVAVLAYPNDFAETSCIAVMEALASGCYVVTTRLGALPETTGGFATLIDPPTGTAEYRQQFTQAVIETLNSFADRPAWHTSLERQRHWVREELTWARRALEWQSWLDSLTVGADRLNRRGAEGAEKSH
jgi:glycosyltransferase involved in cell wall biosynthesis